jgi:hypothetical protein
VGDLHSRISFEDAEERCKQIYYGKVLGTVEMRIPYHSTSGPLARLICWWKNITRSANG